MNNLMHLLFLKVNLTDQYQTLSCVDFTESHFICVSYRLATSRLMGYGFYVQHNFIYCCSTTQNNTRARVGNALLYNTLLMLIPHRAHTRVKLSPGQSIPRAPPPASCLIVLPAIRCRRKTHTGAGDAAVRRQGPINTTEIHPGCQ